MKVNNNGQYVLERLAITQDYFTVYTANANRIDLFDIEEAKIIVTFYTTAKGFIDTLNAWINVLRNMITWFWKA